MPVGYNGPNIPPFWPPRQIIWPTELTVGWVDQQDSVSFKNKRVEGYVTDPLPKIGQWVEQQNSAGTKVKRDVGYVADALPVIGKWVDQQNSAGTRVKKSEGYVSDALPVIRKWVDQQNSAGTRVKRDVGYTADALPILGRWVDQPDSAGTRVKRDVGYVADALPILGRWVDQPDSARTRVEKTEGYVTDVFNGIRVNVEWVDSPQLDRPYRKRTESYITDVLGLFASVPPDYYYGYGKKGGSYEPDLVPPPPQEIETDIAFELGIEENNPEFTIKFGSEPIRVRFKVKEYTIEVQQDVERYKRMWMGLGAALSTVSTGALVFKIVKRMIR